MKPAAVELEAPRGIVNAVDLLTSLRLHYKKPWLVLGKGPTLAKFCETHIQDYLLLTLNHAVTVVPRRATVLAHFTDVEAFDDCAVYVARNWIRTILPWHPHVNMTPGRPTILHYAEGRLGLKSMVDAGYVSSYNSTRATGLPSRPDLATIRVRGFSAVAAFNLLVASHAADIFSLGVDGGTAYDSRMPQKDRLANGQASFDVQFSEIEKTVKDAKIRWTKL